MTKSRHPNHIKTLARALGCKPSEAQARVEQLRSAVKPHEIQVTYVTRHHQWWLSGFTSDGPDYGMMKCYGILAFVDYLNHPEKIISWFQQRRKDMADSAAMRSAMDLFAA